MRKTSSRSLMWKNRLENLVQAIRAQDRWRGRPLSMMLSTFADPEAGAIMLQEYERLRYHILKANHAMLSSLPYDKAKAMKSTAWRRWLHKELSKIERAPKIHGGSRDHLIASLSNLPSHLFVFSFGIGVNSISDLMLNPMEQWTLKLLTTHPKIRRQLKFDQKIRKVLLHQTIDVLCQHLSSLPLADAEHLFVQGKGMAQSMADYHFEALSDGWRRTQTL